MTDTDNRLAEEAARETFAPEVIYLQDGDDCEPLPNEHYDEQVTWCRDFISEDDTKYIRADLHESALAAAVAQERERCAKVCKVIAQQDGYDSQADDCAKAIRALAPPAETGVVTNLLADALREIQADCEAVAKDDSISIGERRTWRAIAHKCNNALLAAQDK